MYHMLTCMFACWFRHTSQWLTALTSGHSFYQQHKNILLMCLESTNEKLPYWAHILSANHIFTMRASVLCCSLHVHSKKACKCSYLESLRDHVCTPVRQIYVEWKPACCQLDARSKGPEVFSLREPEHLPGPEVHGKHSNPQLGKGDYPAQESIDIHLKQMGCTVWQSLDRATKKNVSVGRETWNTIQRKPGSYKQALAVVEPGRA